MSHGIRRIASLTLCLGLALGPAAAADRSAAIAALIEGGELDEAVRQAERWVREDDRNPSAHMSLAQALATRAREVRRVVDQPVDLSRMEGQGVRLSDIVGDARIEIGYDEAGLTRALAAVDRAIELAPKERDLHFSKCYLLTDAGRNSDAAEAIRQTVAAFDADPSLAGLLASYGSERAKRGDMLGAAILLETVADAYPARAEVQVEFASVLLRVREPAEAVERLAGAVGRADAAPQALRKAGQLAMLGDDFELARRAFDRAYRLEWSERDRLLSLVAQLARDRDGAVEQLAAMAEPGAVADPSIVESVERFLTAARDGAERARIAEELVARGNDLLALPLVALALETDPDDAAAVAMRREIHDRLGFPLP